MVLDCSAMICPSWNLTTALAPSPSVTTSPLSTGSPEPADFGGFCGEDTVTLPEDCVICPAGAANSTLTGKKVASVRQEKKRSDFVFIMSAQEKKRPETAPRGASGLFAQKARHSVWLRH